ncbi:MAG: M23 family metallopeptidase [Alphaproteobacteria bacterium]|nr:MAG: M23 family metallopeptidase [Alphaproteobacteria bacterium]
MRVETLSKTGFLILIFGAMLTSCAGVGGGYSGSSGPYEDSMYYPNVAMGRNIQLADAGAGADERDQDRVVVRKGDTLYSIARAHNVDVQTLIDLNGLAAPYHLREGQTLRIPVVRSHVVEHGETIYSISKSYNVDMASLALMNNIEPPYTISVGQELRLPGTEAGTVGWDSQMAGAPSLDEGDMIIADPDRYKAQIGTADEAYNTGPDNGRFLRPVSGRLISTFGKKNGGQQNDGINVAAPEGAPIFAADDGVVTYTGNELRGYGNLILIKHADGWVSAYAHIQRFRVARGDQIRRGQHIADVGQTGNVTSPQLHFELRDGVNPVNPVHYLSTR